MFIFIGGLARRKPKVGENKEKYQRPPSYGKAKVNIRWPLISLLVFPVLLAFGIYPAGQRKPKIKTKIEKMKD